MSPEEIAAFIVDVPDFPKPGIVFKDITPLLANPSAFDASVSLMAEQARALEPDVIVGIESRGFIFATPMARQLGLPVQILRKPGKLPRSTVSMEYALEYGVDRVELHADAVTAGQRVLVVDDVIATGGTAGAAARLVEQLGGEVAGLSVLIELSFLNGRDQFGAYPLLPLLRF